MSHEKPRTIAEKQAVKMLSVVSLSEMIEYGIDENTVSLGNNIREEKKKPTISVDAKMRFLNKNSIPCRNIENHPANTSEFYCKRCSQRKREYIDCNGEFHPFENIDVSHTDKGSWALNQDPEAYLDEDNWMIETKATNRNRAAREKKTLENRRLMKALLIRDEDKKMLSSLRKT